MNGVHDLGGTDGVGPVVYEVDEPVWHADREKATQSNNGGCPEFRRTSAAARC